MSDRAEYLLRALVTANRERKMAQKTRDAGLIRSAEGRLARVWRDAHAHIGNIPNAEVPGVSAQRPLRLSDPEAKADVAAWVSEITSSKAKATAFLKKAGLLEPDGSLSPNYYTAEQIAAHESARGVGGIDGDPKREQVLMPESKPK